MRFRRWLGSILLALIALYLYFAFVYRPRALPLHPFFEGAPPTSFAHRGGGALWPENTLFACGKARELGVDVLETDLRETADGVIVLMHDRTVDRTTDGTGRIDELRFDEVQRLDAGFHFRGPDGDYPFRERGLTVPSLDELFSTFSDARMNLEMKFSGVEQVQTLCDTIRRSGMEERVVVASFRHDLLGRFREACPRVATSASAREALAFYVLLRLKLSSLFGMFGSPAVAFQVPERLGERLVITENFVKAARQQNRAVHVWTVDEPSDMKRLLAAGVDGIMTSYPDRLLEVVNGAGVSPAGASEPE